MRVRQGLVAIGLLSAAALVMGSGGCGTKNAGGLNSDMGSGSSGSAGDDGSAGSGGSGSSGLFGSGSSDASDMPSCATAGMGWSCAVAAGCDQSSSTPTTLSGKVFDPAGANPLYNVIVFVPNVVSELPAITPGTTSCQTCDVTIGDYVTATTTAADGTFTLNGVPTGSNVPVTVQIGKWRRTVTVNIPKSCGSNSVSDGTLRLPKNQQEGDMPQMALLTGGCDDISCFLTGMGVDMKEFTGPTGSGRVHVYQGGALGGGGGPTLTGSRGTAGTCGGNPANCSLWNNFPKYDLVLFSCECGENLNPKGGQGGTPMTNLRTWLDQGGKVFASHYQYSWFEYNAASDFKGVANWGNTGTMDIASALSANFDIDTSFPKGLTFAQWLNNNNALANKGALPNASTTNPPQIKLQTYADSVKSVNAPTNQWIYGPDGTSKDVKYMSFGTPIGGYMNPEAGPEAPKSYCGKAVFTDLHTGGSEFAAANNVPDDCGTAAAPGSAKVGHLSNQQKALEFLFFDLSACVQNDSQPVPMLPPPK